MAHRKTELPTTTTLLCCLSLWVYFLHFSMHYNLLNSSSARTVSKQELDTVRLSVSHVTKQYGWLHKNAELQYNGKMFHFSRVKFIDLTEFTELTTAWLLLYFSNLPLG